MTDENKPERNSTEMRLGLGPGSIVEGRYEIIRLLGEGGMGAVFEARHRTIGRSVALKILKPELTMSEQYTGRFLQEARSAAELHHRHIVEIMDYGVSDGKPYMVMEYLRGESMAALLQRKGVLSVGECVEIIEPVLRALSVAHERGIVHRDIKPENIFLVHEEDGVIPKVVDFGIAKRHRAEDVKLTTDAMALGTPAYMAPEQVMSSKNATGAADQYAVGVTLYESLTGENPFDADNLNAFIVAKATQDPTPLDLRRPDLDRGFVAIVMKTLQRKPEDRFASVLALREALLPYRAGAAALQSTAVALSAEVVKSAPTGGLPRAPDAPIPAAPSPGAQTIPGGAMGAAQGAQNDAWSLGHPSPAVDPRGATVVSGAPQPTPAVMTVGAPPAVPAAPSGSRGPMLAGVVALVVAVGGGIAWKVSQSPAAAPTHEPTPPPPPPPPRPGESTVMFDIRIEPSSALIFLDGEQIGVGHSAVTRPHDGRRYQLEVRAAGYVPVHEVLTADADNRLERSLVAEARPTPDPPGPHHPLPHGNSNAHVVAPPPNMPSVPTPPPPPPPPPSPRAPDPRHPNLDRNNPFGT